MNRPDAILLTKDMAKKYFGEQDPMGKTLLLDNKTNVTVTGVFADIPANGHLQFDFVMPLSAIAQTNSDLRDNVWDNFNFYSYLQFDRNFHPTAANLAALEKQIDDFYKKHVDEKALKVTYHLQPLTAIHLHSDLQVDLPGRGNIQYVNIFFVVALFILIVACINFMNLATARSVRRAKEVGFRKVVGALRGQLIAQFLGESILIAFISLVLALILVFLLLPLFDHISGKTLTVHILDGQILAGLIGMALITGLIAGSNPALFLSGFQPSRVLKGNLRSTGGSRLLRNSLVVLQFVISIVLLAGTALVYSQLRFIRNMNLGFDKSNLLYSGMTGDLPGKQRAMIAELKQNPLTADFAISENLPVKIMNSTASVTWTGKNPGDQTMFSNLAVNEDFFDVYQLKIIAGRAFSKSFIGDSSNYIVNEKVIGMMGMRPEKAIGQPFSLWGVRGTIVGVVKNFNFKPVQQAIEPMILHLNQAGGFVTVRARPGSTEATIKAMEKIFTSLNPAYPFSYGFVDQDLADQYKGEQQMGNLFNIFAVLAIFISCMGLYGLSAFMAEQRTREIGVRKVLGASVAGVVFMLANSFTRLILISVIIAVPIAWWAMNKWLEVFAFHVQVSWMVFLLASLIALAVAWATISYESVRAAIANPAKSLRSE